MSERKSRRPVTEKHPHVRVAIQVLQEKGVPMTSLEIFERAVELGLVPETARHSIRGRLSQHQEMVDDPRVVPMGGGKYGLAAAQRQRSQRRERARQHRQRRGQ